MIKILGKATASLILVFAFVRCSSVQPAYQSTMGAQPYSVQQGEPVTMQTFYDELEPYGQWINDPELGYVWAPDVDQNFRPYATNGHWVETEYGNTWVSDYDWGWAAFHYGRWRFANDYGWEWIPGTEWGPAWVNWRTGGDYYGWAPLGPGIDINVSFGSGYYEPDNYWVFVPRQYLCSPSINRYYLPANRNMAIIRNTSVINNVYNGGNRRYISGPRTAEIQRYSASPVNIYHINNNNRPGATRVRNNTVNIYRPQIAANGYGNNQAAPARSINRGGNDDSRNRFNNNGRNNGNANNNAGFGNQRQWGNQRTGSVQNNGQANPASGGNTNGFGRPARTDNNNLNGNQFPQRGVSNPNNHTGINNQPNVPANANGNNPSNTNGRQARENQAVPNTNTNGQPGYDWRASRNFDRNRNRTPEVDQQLQQNQAQQQQRQQQMQQNQAQQQQMQQQREQQNQQRQQEMQQQREQQNQQQNQQREQQNQQRQQEMQQQREQQNQQRQQQQQLPPPPQQQQERPARQDAPPSRPGLM